MINLGSSGELKYVPTEVFLFDEIDDKYVIQDHQFGQWWEVKVPNKVFKLDDVDEK